MWAIVSFDDTCQILLSLTLQWRSLGLLLSSLLLLHMRFRTWPEDVLPKLTYTSFDSVPFHLFVCFCFWFVMLIFLFYFVLCIWVFCLCVNIWTVVYAWCSRNSEESKRSLGTEVTCGCEASHGCWEPDPGLLQEQVLLTTDSSLQPLAHIFLRWSHHVVQLTWNSLAGPDWSWT